MTHNNGDNNVYQAFIDKLMHSDTLLDRVHPTE